MISEMVVTGIHNYTLNYKLKIYTNTRVPGAC
jgi:hypothetical protein